MTEGIISAFDELERAHRKEVEELEAEIENLRAALREIRALITRHLDGYLKMEGET